LIGNVLLPEDIDILPDKPILCVDWPDKLYQKPEEKITLLHDEQETPFFSAEIIYHNISDDRKTFRFLVRYEDTEERFLLKLGR
jgi:hypothetical protein